jgi:hypothetical protein
MYGEQCFSMNTLSEEVEQNSQEHVYEYAARKIVGKIQSAKTRGDIAERRFLWELLQNACDTALECGCHELTVRINLQSEGFSFIHNGGFFKIDDIGALILGGSGKPFENSDLTGKFGTGFLLSHAVSRVVTVSAWVRNRSAGFAFTLRRDGDDKQIRANFEDCKHELDLPRQLTPGETRFEYHSVTSDGHEVAQQAMLYADRLLPYVFAFNSQLSRVEIVSPAVTVYWQRHTDNEEALRFAPSSAVKVLPLIRSDGDGAVVRLKAYVHSPADGCLATAIFDSEGLRPLGADDPRLYFHFPLEQGSDVGLPIVIHAPFDVDEGRTVPNFLALPKTRDNAEASTTTSNSKNTRLFRDILEGLPSFLTCLARLPEKDALRAVSLCSPARSRFDSAQWSGALRDLLHTLGSEPIVRTDDETGWLQPTECRFPVGTVGPHTKGLQVDVRGVWRLGTALGFKLGSMGDAEAWEQILLGWFQLGIDTVKTLTAEDLLQEAREAGNLVSLASRLKADHKAAHAWLVDLLDLLAPNADDVPVALLDRILPNQNGVFSPCSLLHIDKGIDASIKDIAMELGDDVRAILLDDQLTDGENAPRFGMLSAHVQQSMTNQQAATRIVSVARQVINESMTKGSHKLPAQDRVLRSCVKLALWLARRRPMSDSLVNDLPFVTADGDKADLQPGRDLKLLPVEAWPDSAKQFVDVFPESSRLSSAYYELAADDWPLLREALLQWRIVVPEPFLTEAEYELKADVIAKLAWDQPPPIPKADEMFHCREVGRIPLLGDIIGRIGVDEQRARLFFAFLLNYVAPRDETWRLSETATSRKDPDQSLAVRPCEWLGRVKRDRWVPDASASPPDRLPATRDSLRPFVPWSEIVQDERTFEFLALFGFDRLEVWIRSKSGDDAAAEQNLRDKLAHLAVDATESGLGLDELFQLLQKRRDLRKTVASNRLFGLMIQGVVEQILKDMGLQVRVDDYGYDLLVYERGEADPDIDIWRFKAGTYLVEVKAVSGSSSEVRLTPLQAKTSVDQGPSYVVCVVDLRHADRTTFDDREYAFTEVRRCSRLVVGVGNKLEPFVTNVEEASSGNEGVRVDQTQQLRYCLSEDLWAAGLTLESWIGQAFGGRQPLDT